MKISHVNWFNVYYSNPQKFHTCNNKQTKTPRKESETTSKKQTLHGEKRIQKSAESKICCNDSQPSGMYYALPHPMVTWSYKQHELTERTVQSIVRHSVRHLLLSFARITLNISSWCVVCAVHILYSIPFKYSSESRYIFFYPLYCSHDSWKCHLFWHFSH